MDEIGFRIYNNVCRLCLCNDGCLLSIFDETYTFLPQRIAACVNVEVHPTDKMPTMICKQCLKKVEEWFEFKRSCEDSQSQLRYWCNSNLVNNRVYNMDMQIKQEVVSEDQLQIIEPTMTIKTEPMDFNGESDEQETLHIIPQPADQNSEITIEAAVNNSLMVPTLEVPAIAHGLNAPMYTKTEYPVQRRSRRRMKRLVNILHCRICYKKFSTNNNRVRHERNVHRRVKFNGLDSGNDSISNENETENSNPETEQKFEEETPQLISRPTSIKDFLNFNRRICNMLETLTCDCCHILFTHAKNLMAHLQQKIVYTLLPYTCYFCCVTYPNRSHFMKHVNKKYCKQRSQLLHSGNLQKPNLIFKCRQCKELVVRKIFLARHILKNHLDENNTDHCKTCKHTFQDENESKEHFESVCYFKMYCCICQNSFECLEDFDSHSKMHDSDSSEPSEQLKNIFANCSMSLANKRSKSKWLNQCYLCDKRFLSNANLMRHFKNAHRKRTIITCQYCGENFGDKDDLVAHIREDHIQSYEEKSDGDDNTELNKYSCGQCGKLFSTLELWCEHQKSHSENNVHKCSECNRVFVSADDLELHKSSHPNIKLKLYRCSKSNSYTSVPDFSSSSNSPMFSCLTCEQNFNSEEELQDHLEVHDTKPTIKKPKAKKKKVCSYCHKYFSSAASLYKHKRFVHKVISKFGRTLCTCTICQVVFSTPGSLQRHERNMHGTKEKKLLIKNIKTEAPEDTEAYPCPTCRRTFSSEKGMLIHLKKHETKEQINELVKLQCQLCNKKVDNVQLLLTHLKTHSAKSLNNILHSEKVGLECNICDKKYINNTGLTSHLKTHHIDEMNSGPLLKFRCTRCPKQCLTKNALTSHIQHIHNEAVFHCAHCIKSFSTKASLSNHTKMHLRKNIKCMKCGEGFSSQNDLMRHGKIHDMYCVPCNKQFSTKQGLKSHLGWHHRGKKQYSCSTCKEKFDIRSEYITHMKTHSKRFQCEHCTKVFYYYKSLEKHTQLFHSKSKAITENVKKSPSKSKPKVKVEEPDFQSDRLYKCTKCNTTFGHSKTLRLHVLSAHMDTNP